MKKLLYSFLLFALLFAGHSFAVITIDIQGITTVAGLKRKIAQESGIPVSELHIIVKGRRMADNTRIADLNIQPEDTINAVQEGPRLSDSASASSSASAQRRKPIPKASRGVSKKKR